MHSITKASDSISTAVFTIRSCSITFARDGRKTGYSAPSGIIILGKVPVVLQHVRIWPARIPDAINRATLDLPRVPLT